MKRITEPGAIVRYQGRTAVVLGIGTGRTISLRYIDEPTCPTCHREPRFSLLEDCLLFQEGVEAVATVVES